MYLIKGQAWEETAKERVFGEETAPAFSCLTQPPPVLLWEQGQGCPLLPILCVEAADWFPSWCFLEQLSCGSLPRANELSCSWATKRGPSFLRQTRSGLQVACTECQHAGNCYQEQGGSRSSLDLQEWLCYPARWSQLCSSQFPGTVTYAVLMPLANWNQLGFFKSPFIQRADIFCALFWSWFGLLKNYTQWVEAAILPIPCVATLYFMTLFFKILCWFKERGTLF